jgi:hypothetical protein
MDVFRKPSPNQLPFAHLPNGPLFTEDFSDLSDEQLKSVIKDKARNWGRTFSIEKISSEQRLSALEDDCMALEVHTAASSWRLAVSKGVIPVAAELLRRKVPELEVDGFGKFDRFEVSRAIVLMVSPWWWARGDSAHDKSNGATIGWLLSATAFLLQHEVSRVQSPDNLHPLYKLEVEWVVFEHSSTALS